jgi:hypothetical protein
MRIAAIALALLVTAPAFGYWIRDCKTDVVWSGQTEMVADMNPGNADAVDVLYGFGNRNEYMAEYQDTRTGSNSSGGSTARAPSRERGERGPGPIDANDLLASPLVVFKGTLYFVRTTCSGPRTACF